MVKHFSPHLTAVLALAIAAGAHGLEVRAQGAPAGSPFEAQALGVLEQQCAHGGAPLPACQQLAVELKRRQTQADPVVAMDEDEAAPQDQVQDQQPRLTEGEQRAARTLRCAHSPGASGCGPD